MIDMTDFNFLLLRTPTSEDQLRHRLCVYANGQGGHSRAVKAHRNSRGQM